MAANLPQGASDIFESFLPMGLAAWPDRAKEINGIVVFSITGDGGGTWVLDCMSSPPKVTKDGAVPDGADGSTVQIEVDHDSFKKMMLNSDEGMNLYFANKIRISGSSEVALRLRVLFDITRRNIGVST